MREVTEDLYRARSVCKLYFFLLLVGNSRMVQCRGGEMLSIVEYIRHAYCWTLWC